MTKILIEEATVKQVLEALEKCRYRSLADKIVDPAITALREALAEQPAQQEPVAWVIWLHGPAGHFEHKQFAELEFERRNKEYPDPDRKLLPLYTSPPQRTWVGLTDEEIIAMRHLRDWTAGWTDITYTRAIEAKLKEKNT